MSTTSVSLEPSGAALTRAEINRANAANSTGPKTEEGKKRASLNAFRHGLTAQIMMLPAEEAAAYKQRCQEFRDQYQPQGPEEERLVQILADTAWRLMRVPAIEAGIQAHGTGRRKRYKSAEDDDIRLSLATAAEFRDQSKALANIALYEHRLDRRYRNARAELEAVQARRRAAEPAQKAQHPSENGFVFSNLSPGTCEASVRPPANFHQTTLVPETGRSVGPDCKPTPLPAKDNLMPEPPNLGR